MAFTIAVVIVSYNSAEVLPECISALSRHLGPDQVIVVDNTSTDDSVAIADGLGADVIANDSNMGFGGACNIGAQAAAQDLLMFMNPDVCLTSVDTAKLQKLVARRPLGLLAPPALLVDDAGHREPTRRQILPWPYYVAREAIGPVLPREISNRRAPALGLLGKRSWLAGALLLSVRTEFLDLGGFDERLFLYYEDQELSERYARHGLPVSVTDAIAARHDMGGSSGAKGALRPIPSAASAMSSIEWVGIAHGRRSARCAWALYRGLQWFAGAVMRLTARGPLSTRSKQKLQELHGTRSAMAGLLEESTPHYPLVRALAYRSCT
jgi:N-acetylglucosaminyl-diphospho-decaprenol L-rhamnosyltransferase